MELINKTSLHPPASLANRHTYLKIPTKRGMGQEICEAFSALCVLQRGVPKWRKASSAFSIFQDSQPVLISHSRKVLHTASHL